MIDILKYFGTPANRVFPPDELIKFYDSGYRFYIDILIGILVSILVHSVSILRFMQSRNSSKHHHPTISAIFVKTVLTCLSFGLPVYSYYLRYCGDIIMPNDMFMFLMYNYLAILFGSWASYL
eukprot:GHVH01003505.1.p1 GENE.GHVH01003505.1~~GHVH01003505.1.p1  ORF type:complete len:123 (+),score=8.29 GHVH01003505.1:671-1039(+)